jgi:hypothetical protein
MSEPPCALIKQSVPMGLTVCLESVEQTHRHPAAFAGDHFDLAINPLLRVDSI